MFYTKETDIESCFLLPEHINHLYPEISVMEASQILDLCTNEVKETSIEIFTNSRKDIEKKERREANQPPPNFGELARQIREKYDQNSIHYRHGKTVMGRLKANLKARLGINVNFFKVSPYIKDDQLVDIAHRIWE